MLCLLLVGRKGKKRERETARGLLFQGQIQLAGIIMAVRGN
jgi:hypothetical protein